VPTVTKQIREGAHYDFRILAVGERTPDGRLNCPTIAFFEHCESTEPEDLIKLSAHLDWVAELGTIRDPKKFKNLEDTGLWEFRTKHGIRLLCFRDGNAVWVCTNGTIKKRDDLEDADLDVARRWKRQYEAAKQSNTLLHEPEHIG
jgi:hypothetical protein